MTSTPLEPAARRIDRDGAIRIVSIVASALLVVAIASEVVEIATNLDRLAFPLDGDRVLYMDAARSWLNGTGFYHPYQLAGPYEVRSGDILYPPPMLLVFAPLAAIPEPSPPSSITRSRSASRSRP